MTNQFGHSVFRVETVNGTRLRQIPPLLLFWAKHIKKKKTLSRENVVLSGRGENSQITKNKWEFQVFSPLFVSSLSVHRALLPFIGFCSPSFLSSTSDSDLYSGTTHTGMMVHVVQVKAQIYKCVPHNRKLHASYKQWRVLEDFVWSHFSLSDGLILFFLKVCLLATKTTFINSL